MGPHRQRRRRPRRTPREKYLRLAVELAHSPTSHGLPEAPFVAARVTFNDVASALGITRPAFYRLWPSQYDFWIDLTRFIAFEVGHSARHATSWTERPAELPPAPPILDPHEIDERIWVYTNSSQDIAYNDIRVVIRAAKLGYPAVADLGEIRQAVETERLADFASFLDRTLASIGRATDDAARSEMSASMWCIAEGLSLLNRLLPERCSRHRAVDFGHGSRSWGLHALATRSLYFGLSSPAEIAGRSAPRPPQPSTKPGPRPNWSPAETEVLETAAELFVESVATPHPDIDASDVLGYATIARVATLAGVTRRTIYNVWATREAMMSDLLAELLTEQRDAQREILNSGRQLGPMTDDLIGPPGVPAPVDPSLAFLLDLGNDQHCSMIAASHGQLAAALAEHLDAHLESVHRSPRSNISTEDLGLLWLALVQGGQRLRRTNPSPEVEFGRAFEAIVDQLTVEE